jgi:hypothetical protein
MPILSTPALLVGRISLLFGIQQIKGVIPTNNIFHFQGKKSRSNVCEKVRAMSLLQVFTYEQFSYILCSRNNLLFYE